MNKMTKKTMTVVLAGTFMFSMATAGFAQTAAIPVAELTSAVPAVVQEVQALGVSQMYGTIVDVNKEGSTTAVEVQSADGTDTMIFYIDDNTYLIDAMTGIPMDLDKRTTDQVSVYYGPAVTMSIPAKSTATAIIGNIAQDASYPRYAKVEAVETLDNGDIAVTTDSGSRIVTLGKDMPISPFVTKNIVSIHDITKGSELVLWYDVMTLSLPAQANAEKAVLLHVADAEQPVETPEAAEAQIIVAEGKISVAGTEIAGNAYTVNDEDGNAYTMVPARAIAEQLGYEVLWSDGTVTVKLKDAAQSATYTVGSTHYGANRMLVNLPVAPENKDGVTYVPLSFFSETLHITVSGQ